MALAEVNEEEEVATPPRRAYGGSRPVHYRRQYNQVDHNWHKATRLSFSTSFAGLAEPYYLDRLVTPA